MSRENTVLKENVFINKEDESSKKYDSNISSKKDQREIKILAKDITRTFTVKNRGQKGVEEFVAIKDINLEIRAGEFITLVGPSGCGKSTFLDILSGLSKPTSGELYIDGKLVKGPALDRGIVLQGYALFPWRNVRKNIEYGLELKKISKKERKEISQKYIDLVGLNGFEDRYIHELSGGMRQRVAIARALAYDPEVLLMDEPFAAVDAQTREVMQEELLRIWEKTNKTIVFITHSIEEAVFLADRVAVLSANPGEVKEIINVDLPRPRKLGDVRNSPDFNWLSHKVWELLHNVEDKKSTKIIDEHRNIAEEISPTANL
ncbi:MULTISPECIES: ABC transporter ATP-binding protein [Clostridium]|jgi:NitT/TauT family transport system ATP-binding protein|uniref:ABC transporter ATP-binding protein n=1 Tax=Clostridium TaxID=1485 RepID=UPI000289F6F1|nr:MULTISPECIES: ABC transporter ATP-binding protein [Clostridium]MDF2505009.1 ABC-type nitrate/sulfonate/bicarbonate transport system, ATPase component [Clostridium sp.]